MNCLYYKEFFNKAVSNLTKYTQPTNVSPFVTPLFMLSQGNSICKTKVPLKFLDSLNNKFIQHMNYY